ILLGLINYFQTKTLPSLKYLSISFIYNQIYSVVLYMSNMFFLMFLIKRYKNELFVFKHLIKGIIGSVAVTLIVLLLLRFTSEVYLEGETFQEFIDGEKVQYYTYGLFISLIVTSIFYGIFYYRHTQDKKLKEQKIIAGTASAKFDALKNQLDPHFLFNSLNVLTSLIEENPDAATKFTTSLSKVYRYVLEQKNKDLVTLEEELKFAKLYMTLIRMRFEDSIVFTIPESLSNPQAKVVPLSLQLLLENAVKHNKVTPTNKLYITITEEGDNLVIKNNIQTKEVLKEGTGVGLRNIQQRYYLLTDRPVSIQKNEKEFYVSIPLLTKNATRMTTQETYISEKKYERAKERVEKLKGFYIHFSIYIIMVPVFIFLNIKSTGFPWAIFPIAGWGFGVVGHAMEAFDYNPFLGRNWEEKKIKELMDKDEFDTFK
ncbi:MAG: 2TM domain-containing protein, partial [Flavobacteriaceae bacterium]|nr:2TM domain-containing protein [Flavobacteriaceae bacterium]